MRCEHQRAAHHAGDWRQRHAEGPPAVLQLGPLPLELAEVPTPAAAVQRRGSTWAAVLCHLAHAAAAVGPAARPVAARLARLAAAAAGPAAEDRGRCAVHARAAAHAGRAEVGLSRTDGMWLCGIRPRWRWCSWI